MRVTIRNKPTFTNRFRIRTCITNSKFSIPSFIIGEVQRGTIQRIGGQKPRLAGYIIGSVFYPVFLDKDHLFYQSTKK